MTTTNQGSPRGLCPQTCRAAVTGHIVRWWLKRWEAKRIEREDGLERLAAHTLVHPIRHGAGAVAEQLLFEEEWEA